MVLERVSVFLWMVSRVFQGFWIVLGWFLGFLDGV